MFEKCAGRAGTNMHGWWNISRKLRKSVKCRISAQGLCTFARRTAPLRAYAEWHTLAQFLHLVGVNAAVYRVYNGTGTQRASLERVFLRADLLYPDGM